MPSAGERLAQELLFLTQDDDIQMAHAEQVARNQLGVPPGPEVRDLVADAVRLLITDRLVMFGTWRPHRGASVPGQHRSGGFVFAPSELSADETADHIRAQWDLPQSKSPHGNLELGAVGWIVRTQQEAKRAAELALSPSPARDIRER